MGISCLHCCEVDAPEPGRTPGKLNHIAESDGPHQRDGWAVPCSVTNLATFLARFSDFSDPFSDFFFLKHLATNLATFGKTLATFQMSPVLSCEHEILSYTSPCVCSDQWELAPAERSDRTAADIDVNELRMCTRCCHGPITCLLLLCLKWKLFNWTVFSSTFFLSHALILLTVTEL